MFKSRQSRTLLLGHCPGIDPTQIVIFPSSHLQLSILESQCHKPLISHGLTLVTPNLHGLEAFWTPGASPTLGSLGPSHQWWHKLLGVTLGSPLCPWCCGHSSWRGAWHYMLGTCASVPHVQTLQMTMNLFRRWQSDLRSISKFGILFNFEVIILSMFCV